MAIRKGQSRKGSSMAANDVRIITAPREILREVRRPGRIHVSALVAEDVIQVEVVKAHVVEILQGEIARGIESSGWALYQFPNGYRKLEPNNGGWGHHDQV